MRTYIWAAAALSLTGSVRIATAADSPAPRAPPLLFSAPLRDVPGRKLSVYQLTLQPPSRAMTRAHQHPGSVYVYVTKGTARLGLKDQPVQVVHTGESFFEPQGAWHTVAESASDTEPAVAIAVVLEPDEPAAANGAPHEH